MEYDTNFFEPSQNSNSVVRSVQKAAGIPLEKGLPKGLDLDDLPGIKRDLSNPRGPARSRREQEEVQREYDKLMQDFHERREMMRRGFRPKEGAEDGASNVPDVPVSSKDETNSPGRSPDKTARTSADSAASPEQNAVLQKMKQLPQTPQEILSKPFRRVTEGEIGDLIGTEEYWERGTPLHRKLQDYVRGWMDDAYSTAPLQYGGSGRMIRPQPVYSLATAPVSARGKDGITVESGMERIGARIAGAERNDGTTVKDSVTALQAGLNDIADEGGRLKGDGDFGPVTNARLRRAVLNTGVGPVIDSFENRMERQRRLQAA